MSANSSIEWTDATWNPIRARNLKTGKIGWHCEHATTGCGLCYSEGFNKRLGTGLPFKPGHRKDIEIFLDDEMLTLPLRWKKPRRIFVCSMTDLFADFVLDEWIDKMLAVMALCPQHTFQVLTKRAERMRDYFGGETMARQHRINGQVWSTLGTPLGSKIKHGGNWSVRALPLPNVWVGVSCERQEEADARIPHLLATPTAKRFVSLEPLLGRISLKRIRVAGHGWRGTGDGWQDVLEGWRECKDYPGRENVLDWVIVGGESGPHARPMHPQWARALCDQCQASGVPFFFKQWGEWAPHEVVAGGDLGGDVRAGRVRIVHMARVGKKAAGRLLDGIEHNGFPETRQSEGVSHAR